MKEDILEHFTSNRPIYHSIAYDEDIDIYYSIYSEYYVIPKQRMLFWCLTDEDFEIKLFGEIVE